MAGLVSLVATKPCAGQTPDTAAAATAVSEFAESAVAALATSGLSAAERVHAMRRLIARYSSGRHLSEGILGRSWTAASDEQRARFADSLVDYLAALSTSVSGDVAPTTRVLVTSAERREDRVIVRSRVETGADEPIAIDWIVGASDGGHPIVIDAASEGISLVRTLGSDFRAVLFANGGNLDSLIAAMGHKVKLARE